MWPVSGSDWVTLLPDGSLAIDDVEQWVEATVFTDKYPDYDDSKAHEHFAELLSDAELQRLIKTAQRQASDNFTEPGFKWIRNLALRALALTPLS